MNVYLRQTQSPVTVTLDAGATSVVVDRTSIPITVVALSKRKYKGRSIVARAIPFVRLSTLICLNYFLVRKLNMLFSAFRKYFLLGGIVPLHT